MEQISSNLSVLVLGSGGKAALLCPPRQSHRSAQFTLHSANTLQDGWVVSGGVRAVGISALPWSAHVCSQQASTLPWRKELSGEELAQNCPAPTCILTTHSDTT